MYYSIKSLYHPTIITNICPVTNKIKRFAVGGGYWIELHFNETFEDILKAWIPLTTKTINELNIKLNASKYVYKVHSQSNKDMHYLVTKLGISWCCTCPSYGIRNECKHIRYIKAFIHNKNDN